jgi:hypothetical protein
MIFTKTHIAAAWYQQTGLRFKGTIKPAGWGNGVGVVRTPYGTFKYTSHYDMIVFFKNEAPSCPLSIEVKYRHWENQDGDLEYEEPALPVRVPLGYKSFSWVNGVAVATRNNGTTIPLEGQLCLC